MIFSKLASIHGTVGGTVRDLQERGWQEVKRPEAGDVLVWEAQQFDDGLKQHIGFSIGAGRAISMSWSKKMPVEHDQTFDGSREIIKVFRQVNWD